VSICLESPYLVAQNHSEPKVRITWIRQVVLTGALDLADARRTAGPSSTLTSSNTWAARITSAWYHAASGLWAGSDLNRRQGKSRRGEVTAEANKCPPST
jgi:hypothetical protein